MRICQYVSGTNGPTTWLLNGTKCGVVKQFGTATITQLFSSNAYGSNWVAQDPSKLTGVVVAKNVLLRTNVYCPGQATSMEIVGVHTVLYWRRPSRPRR
jgi:hypothetical protein